MAVTVSKGSKVQVYFILLQVYLSQYLCCSDVVRLERPDLEQQRNELIININEAKNELKVGIYVVMCKKIICC